MKEIGLAIKETEKENKLGQMELIMMEIGNKIEYL